MGRIARPPFIAYGEAIGAKPKNERGRHAALSFLIAELGTKECTGIETKNWLSPWLFKGKPFQPALA